MAPFIVVFENNEKFYNYINCINYKMGIESEQLFNIYLLSHKKVYVKIKVETKDGVYTTRTIINKQCVKVPIKFRYNNQNEFQGIIYLTSSKRKN